MESLRDIDVDFGFVSAVVSQPHTSRLRCTTPVAQGCNKKPVELWKNAFRRMKLMDLDPWHDFPVHDCPTRMATRHRYSAVKKRWVMDEIKVKVEAAPFDRGSMRECFRLKKLSRSVMDDSDWEHSSNYVAKRYLSSVDKQIYFDDVKLQMEAKLWGEAYNRQNPPKKIDIFQLSVLELQLPTEAKDATGGDNPLVSSETVLYHIERYMEGEYRKYNSNSGFVDDNLRNTPQAFSHFTFERSGHRLLVVDIQGVGDLYTDPQIHTADGLGYNDGNLGLRGMALFFHSHICNPLCKWLNLAPFDLAPSEMKMGQTEDISLQNHARDDSSSVKRYNMRRRTVSFNHQLATKSAPSFGPTVVRSADNVHSRQRFISVCSCDHSYLVRPHSVLSINKDHASCATSDNFKLYNACSSGVRGTELSLTSSTRNDQRSYRRPLFTAGSTPEHYNHICRDRAISGDSGYSGVTGSQVASSLPSDMAGNMAFDIEAHFRSVSIHPTHPDKYTGSVESFVDISPLSSNTPASFANNLDLPINDLFKKTSLQDVFLDDDLHKPDHNVDSLKSDFSSDQPNSGSVLVRRHRNISESSDLDAEEHIHMGGYLLHHLMHESYRPSCVNHPTNLDEEIGHSILGQIHHELARLHESGRFLPSCDGGWSYAGLGGLILRQKQSQQSTADGETTNHANENLPTVDWSAVLFHEYNAAQLGCLEAMVVMAHYWLSLPTGLLMDCPIKPKKNDIRSGIDYLWRASEGGDRRSMILLARYLDVSACYLSKESVNDPFIMPNDLLILPSLQTLIKEDPSVLPPISPDAWCEAMGWYRRAVDSAINCPSLTGGNADDYHDAEGNYDSAQDLLPVYRILGRMAEMYYVGAFGIKQNYSQAGDLFNEAGECASSAGQGRLAVKYFDLSEKAYSQSLKE